MQTIRDFKELFLLFSAESEYFAFSQKYRRQKMKEKKVSQRKKKTIINKSNPRNHVNENKQDSVRKTNLTFTTYQVCERN